MMISKKFVSRYLLSSILVLSLIAPSHINGQTTDNGLRLTTSPLPISLKAKPGQTISTDLRIRNSGSQPETLKVGLLAFSADGDGGGPKLRQRQTGDDYFDWVTFSDKEFTLAPNQWHTTKMTIKVPKEAAFGYYYAATFSRVDKSTNDISDQEQAIIIGATATLVLLEVDSPNAKRQVAIESFKTDKQWYEFLPVGLTVTLHNTGNVHSVVAGDIYISRSGSRDIISTITVNDLRGNILPNSKRSFNNSWTEGFPVYDQPSVENSQTPEAKLQWNFSQADQLRFGKYTAHIVLAYDNGTRDVPIESTVEFWVIPWRMIIAVIIVGSLSLFGLFAASRSIWRLVKKRSKDDDFHD